MMRNSVMYLHAKNYQLGKVKVKGGRVQFLWLTV